MNTEDRELLEMAAKAAGIKPPESAYEGFIGNDGTFVFYLDCEGKTVKTWNPLEDDGDAFSLVCHLGIDVEWRADGRVSAYRHANSDGYCFTAFESSREDRSKNTRRAIVRAAAEIGRRMA